MSLIIIKVIGSLIMAITSYFSIKNIIAPNLKIKKSYVLLSLIIISMPTLLMYDTKYSLLVTVIVYVLMIIIIKYLFNIEVTNSILVCGYVMLLTAIIDVTLTIVEIPIFSYSQVRNIWYINIVNSIIIGIITILVSRNKNTIKIFKQISSKVEDSHKLKTAIFTILIIGVVCLLYYNITTIFEFNLQYTITFFSIVLFFILYYIYMEERNNYQKLKDEYNIIFNYVQTFEDWIDNEQMYRHELKNNLSIIRNLSNKKEINKKIDKMLQMNMLIDDSYIEILKDIPKGGLKGLLYYKLALANKYNIDMYIDVSPKINNKLTKINKTLLESICIILGIYIDNAIDECKKMKRKNITIEIYEKDENLNIVISNTCNKVISIKKMNKKGYTSKGKGHGNGLYFANKIIKREKRLNTEQQFLNNYFIQKIIVQK